MKWILFVLLLCCHGYGESRSMWEFMRVEGRVRWIARAIEERELSYLFMAENITIFLPSNDAYFDFVPKSFGYNRNDVNMWRELVLYSSVQGALLLENIKDKDMLGTRLGADFKIYCNKYTDKKGQFTTINGARFIESDIQTENGVLHIMDRVLAPMSSNNTLAEYIERPTIPNLSFESIIKAKIVVPDLEAETRNSSLYFTSFSPNDSFLLAMPSYGKDRIFLDWGLLEKVYRAHIVPYSVLFLPSIGPMPNIQASVGTLSFTRYNGQIYVYNGMVRARVVQANIPVGNGVLHVIDNLLYFVYDNVVQRLGGMQETSKMWEYMKKLPDNIQAKLNSTSVNYTVFAPTDWAFSKIPTSQQLELDRDDEEGEKLLKYLLFGHIIPDVQLDAAMLSHDQMLRTMDNRTIHIKHVDGDTYLESGSVRARLEMTNIGCTNGVIHLISNILFFKNFTIWEAIENIPQLSIMYSFAIQYPDIEAKLSAETSGALTMFMASDSVLKTTSRSALDTLNSFPHMVYQALRGQIVQGQFSSSSVASSVQVGTLAGKSLRIYKEDSRTGTEDEDMMVEGSHVKARVIVKDIWCSNGVLHIVDDILHVAIRSIIEEMDRRPDISYTRTMFRAIPALQDHLSQLAQSFTVFIPHNDAYASLPWASVNSLLKNINKTKELMQAHIVTGVAKNIDELADRQMLQADKNVIYIVKKSGNVYVVNNNMWAKVIVPDIPASNGIIHIINNLVYYPYKTVAEMLDSTDELRAFYMIMSGLPEFNSLVNKGERNLTVFAPSADFLNSLAISRLDRIRNSTHVLRKLFRGHLFPSFRLDDEFLRRYQVEEYVSRSSLNTTFTLRRSGDDTYIDAGYEPAYIDLIGRGYGCSNGVIYVIDGFLNYSPFNLMERLQGDSNIEHSLGYLLRLLNNTSETLLSREDKTYTLLIPRNLALRKLTYTDFMTLDNFPPSERMKVFWRHVLNDTEVTYHDLKQGTVRSDVLPKDVMLETNQDGVFFKWRHVQSKVVEYDRLASNGVIHIVDSFLFTTSDPKTTPRSTTYVPTSTTRVLPVAETGCVLHHPCLTVLLMLSSATFSLFT
ncbi:fasciclin-1-like isoform X2 [Haliotis cracherodii]|uniref:fasciclin-1-like isoform X2 n=1 Tax=Haliotis cracherodii TaxID=6455 RepID=UPI0039E81DD7